MYPNIIKFSLSVKMLDFSWALFLDVFLDIRIKKNKRRQYNGILRSKHARQNKPLVLSVPAITEIPCYGNRSYFVSPYHLREVLATDATTHWL